MSIIELDNTSYAYLIQMLNERFSRAEKSSERAQINHIYKQLKFRSETWLSLKNEQVKDANYSGERNDD